MSDADSGPSDGPLQLLNEEVATQQTEVDLEEAQANVDLVIGWVSHADSKAAFYLTISLAMLGASFTELPALVRVCRYFVEHEYYWWSTLLIACHLGFYGASILSAHYSIGVVKPRLAPDSKTHSWYFFQSIATFDDVNKWREFCWGLDGKDRLQQLIDQIWNISRVAVNKFKSARTADSCLRVALCFGIVSVALTLILDELIRQ